MISSRWTVPTRRRRSGRRLLALRAAWRVEREVWGGEERSGVEANREKRGEVRGRGEELECMW
jgi:hypothetical protein